MNEKELAELRRRYRHDKSNITHVRGCFVNEKKEIISEFEQSLGMISEDDADDILALLRKTMSGVIGRNLLPIDFSTAQVMESEEHKLLSVLRATKLADEDSRRALYEKISSSLEYYYSKNEPSSQALAAEIQSRTRELLLPDNTRKIKSAGENIYLLDRLTCPAVLVECGFLSNPEECELLATEEYQKKLAFSLYLSLVNYLHNDTKNMP